MLKKRVFPIKLLLRTMPEDVYRLLIQRQAKEKLRLNRMVSLEQTIYRIIKEQEGENTKVVEIEIRKNDLKASFKPLK